MSNARAITCNDISYSRTSRNLGPREKIYINITSLLRTLRLSGESRIPISESTQGESRLADELCKVILKVQSLYIKQQFAKGVQRNITDSFKAWITTDSIKIVSTTFCTLVTAYCTCKINCRRVGFFFSKSAKKSVKRGVRVSPQSRSPFSASFHTFCLTARVYLNSQKYGLFFSLLAK